MGHRGVRVDRGLAWPPENTLAAIEEAKRLGADAVEIDVRPCASGEIVVFHDPDLKRMTGDIRQVAELSLRELRGLQAGGGARTEPIPTLVEVLQRCRELGLGLNVEIKHDVPGRVATARAVGRILAAWRGALDLIVSSFDPLVIAAHRALNPRVCHAQLLHESTYHDWGFRIARGYGADGVHSEWSITVPARVGWFVRERFVNSWTINDAAIARRAFELGVSAVITDVPGEMRAAFE